MFRDVSLNRSRTYLNLAVRRDATIAISGALTMSPAVVMVAAIVIVISAFMNVRSMAAFPADQLTKIRDLVPFSKRTLLRRSKGQNFAFDLPFLSIVGIDRDTSETLDQTKSKARLYHELGHIGSWDAIIIFLLAFCAIAFFMNGASQSVFYLTDCIPPPSRWREYFYSNAGRDFGALRPTLTTMVFAVTSVALFFMIKSEWWNRSMAGRPPHEAIFAVTLIVVTFSYLMGVFDRIEYTQLVCETPQVLGKIAAVGQSREQFLNGTLYFLFIYGGYGLFILATLSRVIHRREIYADVNAAYLSGDMNINTARFEDRPPWLNANVEESSFSKFINSLLQPTNKERLEIVRDGYGLGFINMAVSAFLFSLIVAQFLYIKIGAGPSYQLVHFNVPTFPIVAGLAIWYHAYTISILVAQHDALRAFGHIIGSSLGYIIGFAAIYMTYLFLLERPDTSIWVYWILPSASAIFFLILAIAYSSIVFWRKATRLTIGLVVVAGFFHIIATVSQYGVHPDPGLTEWIALPAGMAMSIVAFLAAAVASLLCYSALIIKRMATR